MKERGKFHEDLYVYLDKYVHLIYSLTRKFPKEEMFGSSSQLRRSALSVMLNYIEGYARNSNANYKHFLRACLITPFVTKFSNFVTKIAKICKEYLDIALSFRQFGVEI